MTKTNKQPHNPIIIALDVEQPAQAFALVEQLADKVGMFKVGKQLFTAAGPDVVREIIERGGRVFLDLKFHDIPNTVSRAGVEAARLGVSIFNVHALGGATMMRETVRAVDEFTAANQTARPIILGVTVLTSHTPESLGEIGVAGGLEEEVVRLARLCAAAGIDGVVASPHEIAPIRRAVDNPGFVIVTPGVRPAGAAQNDQSRVMTPAEAVRAGANYLVIGRPITAASDPVAAAEKIREEIEQSAPADVE